MKNLLSALILSLLFACNNEELDLRSQIDSDIKIELREWTSPEKQGLYLEAATEKLYPCINFPLTFEYQFDEDCVRITFTGVRELDPCLSALGPAKAAIDLSHLEKGVYDLELNIGVLKNVGKLIITDTGAKLDFRNQNGIQIMSGALSL